MQNQVDLTLMEFVEKQILPRYTAFGESHGLYHVTRVIKNSLELARMLGADINMTYTIAAYHDLGMEGPRAIHHITSGKILTADARLKKWFSPEQIKIINDIIINPGCAWDSKEHIMLQSFAKRKLTSLCYSDLMDDATGSLKEKEATFAPFYKTISDDYKKAKVLKIGGKR